MDLPSKKLWPIYYRMIKHPQCFNNVLVSTSIYRGSHFILTIAQKKLKEKQYARAADFAEDVELIFSNAMQFNQEGTQIWLDALTMRVCLNQSLLRHTS